MADHTGESESLLEKITDKIKGHDDSSSSDSDDDHKPSPVDSVQSKIYRLFGREKPVHKVLGGGKPADVFLWRDKKISAGVLGAATAVWVLFELLEYHLLTLVCHVLILGLAILFLWSNATTFIHKSPPHIPDVTIPENVVHEFVSVTSFEVNRALAILFLWSNATTFIHKSPPHIPDVTIPENVVHEFVSVTSFEVNRALAILRDIASGRDLKKFLVVIAGLWVVSILGSCFNFVTLFYIAFVLLHTVPVLYEKYEDQVDCFAEKAEAEIKKQYAVFNVKVLSKIPLGPLKGKKD